MKKFVLLFLSALFFCNIAFASSSGLNIDELLEKSYVKVAVTVKIDEKKVKGVITFKEKGFDGSLTCSGKYKITADAKMTLKNASGQVASKAQDALNMMLKELQTISGQANIYNEEKGRLLYKVKFKGNDAGAVWSLYNAQNVAIAKGSSRDGDMEVLDEELFAKFTKTMERFARACTLD